MKAGFFGRIALVQIAVLLLLLAGAGSYLPRVIRQNEVERLKEHLLVAASLVEREASFSGRPGSHDGFCREIKRLTGARVTLIRRDGVVLGDSDEASARMENHLRRPEIQQAVLNGSGSSIRYSDTVKRDLLYVARHVRTGAPGGSGFVRLAMPLARVNAVIRSVRDPAVGALAFVTLVSAVVTLAQTITVRRLVRQVTEFSTSLARGDLRRRLILQGSGEFDAIAKNLNTLASELRETILRNEAENDRLNTILKSIPDVLLILDRKDRVILSSAAAAEFFDRGIVPGQPVVELVRERAFLDLLERMKKKPAPIETELLLELPDERHVTVKMAPYLQSPEAPPAAVVLLQDVTRLRRLEQMRRDFVANVSHELKTPVTAIRGFADTLLEDGFADREQALRFLEIIQRNSLRLHRIVDDLLTLSGLETGVMKIEKIRIPLEEKIRQVMEDFREPAARKGLALKLAFDPALQTVEADPHRLGQILANLIGNAIKYTNRGSVTVGTWHDGSGGGLFVRDTGIGVPREHLPRLGERFYRVDPSRSRQEGGTGLGLAIVKHLVRAHGWTMEIESTEGEGTAVRVSFS